MTHTRSRAAMLVVAAATAALGLAMSAPAANADPVDLYPEIVSTLETDFAAAQPAFQEALVLLPSGLANHDSMEEAQGLLNLFLAADDDGVVAPENLLAGLTEALGGEPLTVTPPAELYLVPTYAEGLADAQAFVGLAASEFTAASAAFSVGDYGAAVLSDLLGVNDLTVYPLEEVLVGWVAGLTF